MDAITILSLVEEMSMCWMDELRVIVCVGW